MFEFCVRLFASLFSGNNLFEGTLTCGGVNTSFSNVFQDILTSVASFFGNLFNEQCANSLVWTDFSYKIGNYPIGELPLLLGGIMALLVCVSLFVLVISCIKKLFSCFLCR